MFSTTLKRNSKLDLGRNDLIKLVTMLEGELQAREIVIAVLKSEQIKSILTGTKAPAGSGIKKTNDLKTIRDEQNNMNDLKPSQTIKYSSDPVSALSRDSFVLYEPNFDHKTSLAIHNLKTFQLESMLKTQKKVRETLLEQFNTIGAQYEKVLLELEDEKRKNRQLIEKYEKEFDREKLENEITDLKREIEDNKAREKEMVLSLVEERKHLVLKLLNEREERAELLEALNCEKRKISDMVEMLEDESKRSLQMESDNEKTINEFAEERLSLRAQIDDKNKRIDELTRELQAYRNGTSLPNNSNVSENSLHDNEVSTLGEGVRSSIVTQPVTTKVHSQSTVTTVSHPKASVAQPAQVKSTSIPSTILPPPSIPVPQPKLGMGTIKKSPISQTNTVSALLPKAVPQPKATNDNVINDLNNSPVKPDVAVSKQTSTKLKTEAISPPKTNNVLEMSPSKNPLKEKILLFEKSAENSKNSIPSTAHSTGTRKLSAGRVPPPVPPNKPTIKPVIPPAVLNRQNSQPKIPVTSTTPTSTNCNSNASQN